MKKALLIISLFYLYSISNTSFAGISKNAKNVLSSKKIEIVLWKKDKNYMKELSKKGNDDQLHWYTTFIDSTNSALKKIPKYWSNDKNIQYKFVEKFSHKIGTVKMSVKLFSYSQDHFMDAEPYLFVSYVNQKGKLIHTKTEGFLKTYISESDIKKTINFLKQILNNFIMTKSEKRIEKKRNKNFSLIKEKKLIICKEDLYKLNANDIKKVYPYTVEIINNREEFEKRFLSDENAYFFFLYKWEIKGQSKYKHCFYNNKNNSVIFYQPSVAFTRSVTSSMYLSKKTLKKLISLINKP